MALMSTSPAPRSAQLSSASMSYIMSFISLRRSCIVCNCDISSSDMVALGYALSRRAVVGDLVDELERRIKPVVRGGQCGQILRRAVRLTRDIAQAQ